MKPLAFTVTGTLVTLALSLGPSTVWAQGRPSGGSGDQGGARPSGGGTATGGTAVSRGGAGGGSTSSGSSGGGSASPSGSSGGSSGSSWGGSSAGSVERPGGARMSGGGARVDPRRLGNNEQRGEAVPRGARPNPGGDRVTGQAVPREGRPPVRGDGGYYGGYYPYGGYYGGYYSGYYPYSSWGYSPWGLGGLYFSNPFWWGYGGYPYWGDYGYGGYGGYGYGSYGGYYGSSREYMRGSLKLKVKPKEAEVFVDGYFMGQVDSFDGTFQQLSLEPGTHRIEIRAKGLEPVTFEVRIDPRETITYRGELHPVK